MPLPRRTPSLFCSLSQPLTRSMYSPSPTHYDMQHLSVGRSTHTPHHSLGSASSNGARLYLPDDTQNDYRRGPSLFLPPSTSSSRGWSPTGDELFLPPTHNYEPLPAELEPPSPYDAGVPEYYLPSIGAGDFEDSFDFSALADQYLDLSAHCPTSSRSSSPSSTVYTDNSDVPEVDTRAAKRRRIRDCDFPRLPTAPSSDDGSSDDSDHRDSEPVGVSPFYHTPTPAPDAESAIDSPGPYYHRYHVTTSSNEPAESLPAPPTLRFSEARKDGRSKRQALACLFCRERKIACGRPSGNHDPNQTCNQCIRRGRDCVYPTESRRGQHSRIKSLARRAELARNLRLGMMLPVLH
ncbi:hypothetical protein C8R47DRAFT_540249 [Mycena vitilis]|nr:hypothetical protein C8R47DRAFT_540249 [Mycena vitilis]